MKLKNIAIALGLAAAGFSAHAVNVSNTINLLGNPSIAQSAGLSDPSGTDINHSVAGAFTDTFYFNHTGAGLVDVILWTSADLGSLHNQQIVFTSATINGVALSIDPDVTEEGTIYRGLSSFQVPASGNLVLTINGYAGLLGSTQSGISASYAGVLNVTPVPEPESYALMLGGLAAIGFVARRRKVI